MDLISRKDAVSRISDLLILELKGERIPTWNEVYNAIGDIPSIPAVPLDKLCEWLSENSIIIPCKSCPNFSNDYCAAIRNTRIPCPKTADDWRRAITKWMEASE